VPDGRQQVLQPDGHIGRAPASAASGRPHGTLFNDQRLQLGHKRGGLTQLNVGVDAPFQRLKPDLVRPRRLSCPQQFRRDISWGFTAPQVKRLVTPGRSWFAALTTRAQHQPVRDAPPGDLGGRRPRRPIHRSPWRCNPGESVFPGIGTMGSRITTAGAGARPSHPQSAPGNPSRHEAKAAGPIAGSSRCTCGRPGRYDWAAARWLRNTPARQDCCFR
jgi:hypothetical protein